MTAVQNDVVLGDIAGLLNLSDKGMAVVEKFSTLPISNLTTAELASPRDIIFVSAKKFVDASVQSKAKVIVHSPGLLDAHLPDLAQTKVLLEVPNAKLAMAHVSRFFAQETWGEPGVHASAKVHHSVQLGANVRVAENVVIGAGSVLGEGVVISANVVIGKNVQVGKDSIFFPNVTVYNGVQIGERVRVHAGSVLGADGFGYATDVTAAGIEHVKIYHTGGLKIENDVEIGASTTIDRGTIGDTLVRAGTKIDNQVQIGHNCQVGKSVLICGKVGVAGSVQIGDGTILAGFSAVADQTKIAPGTIVTGFSGVHADLGPGIFKGFPAQDQTQFNRIQVALQFLPEMVKEYRRKRKSEKKSLGKNLTENP